MAATGSTNWWEIGQDLGTVFVGIVVTFAALYRKSSHEAHGEDIVQRSVGAAFVDTSAANDLRRVADNTDRMVDIMQDRETRWKETELLKKLEEKMRSGEGH